MIFWEGRDNTYHLLSLKLLGRQDQGMVFSILYVYPFPLFSASKMH